MVSDIENALPLYIPVREMSFVIMVKIRKYYHWKKKKQSRWPCNELSPPHFFPTENFVKNFIMKNF